MAVLPSPSNTSAPESQGFEANLDDLFLRFAVGPGRQMNINTAPLQAQAIQTSETPEDFQQEFGQIFSRTDQDRKSTRLNSSHSQQSRMPSSA